MKRRWTVARPLLFAALWLSAEAQAQGIVNGDFGDGLNGWTVTESGGSADPGSVAVVDSQAELREGDSFLVTLSQTFLVPEDAAKLTFTLALAPGFDPDDAFLPDAFEASLLDAQRRSLVPAWSPLATSFLNVQQDGAIYLGSSASLSGAIGTLDLRPILPGTAVTLAFSLVGGDGDTGSGVSVDSVVLTLLPPTPTVTPTLTPAQPAPSATPSPTPTSPSATPSGTPTSTPTPSVSPTGPSPTPTLKPPLVGSSSAAGRWLLAAALLFGPGLTLARAPSRRSRPRNAEIADRKFESSQRLGSWRAALRDT
jgi:hypothetical protein